jgi:DNA-binding response OmpR family regulator
MVVDDDHPILEVMEILLRRIGYEPVLMPDVHEALEMIKTNPPSLVLLDIMMTPINGWQFLEKVRVESRNTEIPVILFTAAPLLEGKITCMHDPKLGLLEKPVSLNELKACIESFLGPV